MLQIILFWFKSKAAKAARKILSSDFKKNEIEDILKGYWSRYKVRRRDIEKQPTFGVTVMVHLAGMSTAFYNELIKRVNFPEIG